MLQKFFLFCFDQLFPPRCVLCRSFETDLCDTCSQGVLPSPKRLSIDKISIQTVFDYHHGNHSRLMEAWKYHGSTRVFEALTAFLPADELQADWIVPVPIHPRRKAERGFNQSELLAAILSERWGIPVSRCLHRRRYTQKQAKLDAMDRAQNLLNAFTAGEVPQGRILLVDDVVTTGATLKSCAAALKAEGAQAVSAFCLMRAEKLFH